MVGICCAAPSVASACAVSTGELQEFVGVQCWDIALHGQLDAVPPLSLQELAALCLYDFHAAGFATSALHTPSGTPEPNALCQACNTACLNHLSALSQAMAKSFTVRGGLTSASFETPSELCSGAFNEVSSALDGLQEEGEQRRVAAHASSPGVPCCGCSRHQPGSDGQLPLQSSGLPALASWQSCSAASQPSASAETHSLDGAPAIYTSC